MSWPENVLERYGAERCPYQPGYWRARCPAHDDESPSLSFWIGRNGALMVGCWAGCNKDRVLACKGLRMSDLFPPQTDGAYGKCRNVLPPRRIVATFDYRDEEGALLFQSVRYVPKDFRQRRPTGSRQWAWGLDGVRLVPYRLPQLLASPHAPVLIVEGERKADRLARMGFVATCNPGGCGMGWLPSYSAVLRGRRAAILPDCDSAGVRHAMLVAGSLLVHGAASIRFVPLPGLSEREDVLDWLKMGGDRDQLAGVISATPEWKPG